MASDVAAVSTTIGRRPNLLSVRTKTGSQALSESPCFPRPECPDGAPRTVPGGILDPSIRLRVEDVPQARRWLVEIIARRAVQIVKDEKGEA